MTVQEHSEEVGKLIQRIEELSVMSDEIIGENQELAMRVRDLEAQLEEVRSLQGYLSRLKGEINTKKSTELGKLIDSLGKLQSHA